MTDILEETADVLNDWPKGMTASVRKIFLELHAEATQLRAMLAGTREVYAVGLVRPDGSAYNVGMSEAGFSNRAAAESALKRARGESEHDYRLITKRVSDWREA